MKKVIIGNLNIMKTKFVYAIVLAGLFVSLVSPMPSFAQISNTSGNQNTIRNQNSPTISNSKDNTNKIMNPLGEHNDSIGKVVGKALEIFTYLAILAAVILIIWIGFQFIMAQGDPKRISELKNWLLWVVIGVAVVIGARVMVNVIINTLESTNTVDPQVLQSAKKAVKK